MSGAAEPPRKNTSTRLRIDVKKKLLNWAIDRSGKSVESLSQDRQMREIRRWLSGESRPTLRQLERFANATLTPLGYLFLSDPPVEQMPIPYFRTAKDIPASRPSLDLVGTVQIIKQRQDWIRDYLVGEGNETLAFVGSAKEADPPAVIARNMRKVLGITEEWTADLDSWEDALAALRDRMEEAGVFVTTNGIVGYNTRRALQVEEFRGFVLVDDYAPFVFVNGADAKAAQMFTLAHELAHIWLGRSAAFDLHGLDPADDATEQACNQIAAEFLVPEEELHTAWGRLADRPDPYKDTARHFKVSRLVVARRALDLDLIDRDAFFGIYNKHYKPDVRTNGGGNFYASANFRIGKRFASMVINAVRRERIPYREAYRLTGLNRHTFEKYAAELHHGSSR